MPLYEQANLNIITCVQRLEIIRIFFMVMTMMMMIMMMMMMIIII